MTDVKVVRFETEAGRPALMLAAAWATLNANRFDLVAFVGDEWHAQVFYKETGADSNEGTS